MELRGSCKPSKTSFSPIASESAMKTPRADAGAKNPLVSIVVAVRNEERHIGACLDALLAQDYPRDRLEILVMDGASTDRTREIAASFADADERVTVLDNPERIAATAFNHGIRAARGDYVGVMSGHAIPAPDYVSRAAAALHETGAWAVGGKILRQGQTPVQRGIALATSSPFGVGNAAHNYASVAREAETVFPGMWPRDVFDHVGWFDTSLVRNQDDELSYRIRKAGGLIWYDPTIRVRYEPRPTLGTFFSQYRQYGFWRVRVVQMHPGALQPRQLVPAVWLVSVALGCLGILVGHRMRLLAVPSVGGYLGLMSVAAVRTAGPRGAVLMLTALATMHVAYGLGVIQGLAAAASRFNRDRARSKREG
jgi:succinoglycan biosynthesis protein ExoA